MKKIFILLTLVLLISNCNSQDSRRMSAVLNNKAIDMYAKNCYRYDSIEAAIPLFREAIKLDPSATVTYINLANCLSMTGHKDEALAVIDSAIAVDTNNYLTHMLKGMYLIRLKKTDEGKHLVRIALEKNRAMPEEGDSCGVARLVHQSLMLHILGEKEAAQSLFKNNRERYSKLVHNNSFKMMDYDADTEFSKNINAENVIKDLWAQQAELSFPELKTIDSNEKIYDAVDTMPQFPKGDNYINGFIYRQLRYPDSAVKSNQQGRVVVGFIVDKEGWVCNIKILKSVCPELDREAMRVIGNMPRWTPGKHNGKNVNVKYNLPVKFILAQ